MVFATQSSAEKPRASAGTHGDGLTVRAQGQSPGPLEVVEFKPFKMRSPMGLQKVTERTMRNEAGSEIRGTGPSRSEWVLLLGCWLGLEERGASSYVLPLSGSHRLHCQSPPPAPLRPPRPPLPSACPGPHRLHRPRVPPRGGVHLHLITSAMAPSL